MNKLLFLLVVLMAITKCSMAQLETTGNPAVPIDSVQPRSGSDEIFVMVEVNAMPQGGMPAFYKFIAEHLHYPKDARKAKAQGKVFVEFIVEKDGTISPENVRTVKGVHPSIDAEAERVVRISPRWFPGTQKGKPVRQRMVLPLTFSLG